MFDFLSVTSAESFAFSAENPTGAKGGGTAGVNQKPSAYRFIQPGEVYTMADIDGPGKIEHIWVTGSVSRHLILRIYWDGQEYTSVESPLPAFFGWAFDDNFKTTEDKYPSLNSAVMLTAPAMGCNCYWPMPFGKHCRITLENRHSEKLGIYYTVSGSKGPQPENLGYFHASYRHAHPSLPGDNYTIIDGIEGAGQFVGVSLAVGLNGTNDCWCEGEVRMYMDGDETPTMHYTGTEDYFGGAHAFGNDHCLRKYQPYSGQYVGMYAVFGNTSEFYNGQQRFLLYRWHIPDPVRFKEDFRMTLDNFGFSGPRYDDFRSVAYWYQTLPSAPLAPLPDNKALYVR